MVKPEYKKIEAYIQGLSKDIKGDVTSYRTSNINEVVRMAHSLMKQRVQETAERAVENNKRKWENFQGGNNNNNNNYRNNNQQNNQRQGNARAMTNAPTKRGRMDWLSEHDTVIVCGEKLVRIPYNKQDTDNRG
ncbi:hypothetical protein Tco_1149673 [Tanacetum coccineum]